MNICYILLLLIILYLFINNKETYINYNTLKIPNKILKNFEKNIFLKNVYNSKVVMLMYLKNNLDVHKYININLNNFLEKKNSNKYRYQIKQKFNNNKLSKYIYKYGYLPIKKYLKLNNVNHGDIRVSKNNWTFNYHYDCIDIILVQLIGTRIVYLKKNNVETKYILNAGNMLYIPMGVLHKVYVKSELNVNFTIVFDYTKKQNKKYLCTLKFRKDYKNQSKRCLTNDCI